MYNVQNWYTTTEEVYVTSFIEINPLKILWCLSSQIYDLEVFHNAQNTWYTRCWSQSCCEDIIPVVLNWNISMSLHIQPMGIPLSCICNLKCTSNIIKHIDWHLLLLLFLKCHYIYLKFDYIYLGGFRSRLCIGLYLIDKWMYELY